ncbi:MAG: hypothetical protein OXB93_02755 [Cytophagales bacterium]|nr:hypothetical protein [Cytophagales bacterium]
MGEDIRHTSGKTRKDKSLRRVLLSVSLIALVLSVKVVVDYFQKVEYREQAAISQRERLVAFAAIDSLEGVLKVQFRELNTLGGELGELKELRDKLIQEKKLLRQSTGAVIEDLQRRVAGYSELLIIKDKEIVQLKKSNEILLEQNTELKIKGGALADSIGKLKRQRRVLSNKVALAGQLKTANIEIMGLSSRGKRYRKKTFSNRHLKKILIQVEVEDNPVATVGKKDFFLRILKPRGGVIFDVNRGSGSFTFQGRELFYTTKKSALYKRKALNLDFIYEKISQYEAGNYTVEIYTTGYLMGSKTFVVKKRGLF